MDLPHTLDRLSRASDTSRTARILSNGRYALVSRPDGTGYGILEDHLITTRGPDPCQAEGGLVFYLRDRSSGGWWLLGSRSGPPTGTGAGHGEEPGRLRLTEGGDGIEVIREVCVPPRLDGEIHRIQVRNVSGGRRSLEVTSMAEIALHHRAAHEGHPVFSKLFLQTEADLDRGALLVRRRPRSPEESHPWLVHAVRGGGGTEYETDRARFLGRGGSRAAPLALRGGRSLTGSVGGVLDPVVSLRRVLDLEAGESEEILFLLAVAPGREEAMSCTSTLGADEVPAHFREAREQAEATLSDLGLTGSEAAYLQGLAGDVLGGLPIAGPAGAGKEPVSGSLRDLVPLGLRPERPFVVQLLSDGAGDRFDLRLAHRAWRAWGLPIDLVVVGGDAAATPDPGAGSSILLPARDLPPRTLDLLCASARFVLRSALPGPGGKREGGPVLLPDAPSSGSASAEPGAGMRPSGSDEPLEYDNGYGGFAADGGEYVIRVRPRGPSPLLPPRPWVNIVANERFGFLVSETGAGFTWAENSREHRLTPWYNDPLLDPHGEALYLRDEESGDAWSLFPGPCPGPGTYEVRHGQGYTLCRYRHREIEQETLLFVPRADPVRIQRVRLTHRGKRPRRISLTSWVRLDLAYPSGTIPRAATWIEGGGRAILARNPLAGPFGRRVVFGSSVIGDLDAHRSWTADRAAFLGPGGTPAAPRALSAPGALDGRIGPGLDPCLAQRVELDLPPGAVLEVSFLLGEVESEDEVRALLDRYPGPGEVEQARREAVAFWRRDVSRIEVETPSRALDLLVNHWLPYQVLSGRMWARSALYQSGGAFGFRDQLQDASALVMVRPDLTRSQILLHARHQFVEGDVMHWWHPPLGEGIRTRFGDDLLWLPYLTASYIETTGDADILDERIPFLEARALAPGEDETFLLPGVSERTGTLYEHCCLATDRSLATGRHGLPLFGSGDWNDGMNRVGREGRGESVWLGQFLHAVLDSFLPLCGARKDEERVRRYRSHRDALRSALNETGWDGEWYRRGYYDDGAPLGSKESDEARIDALVQAWSILSGTAPPARAKRALESLERHLLSEEEGILRLLAPPFDTTSHDPGYIRGYLPGVRENGGQYTHAALWVVRAYAELGRNDRVARLLEMMNPVTHAATGARAERYGLEPYVVAADVYGVPPHVGRGGWSWYTGAAGWMYRIVLESLLGMRVLEGRTLAFRPCIPDAWRGFQLRYRLPGEETVYEVETRNPDEAAGRVKEARLDEDACPIEDGVALVPLLHDGADHRVELVLGPRAEGGA